MLIDAQVHANALRASEDEGLDSVVTSTITAMDAIGLAAAIVDDFDGWQDVHMLPGHFAENGAWRADLAFSERAVEMFPDRFGYLTRVELTDPDLAATIARIPETPGALALRMLYGPGPMWLDPAFGAGDYDVLFRHASEYDIPVFVYVSGQVETLEPYVRRFPDLRFVIDHMGLPFPLEGSPAERAQALETVLSFAKYPNAYLKWCHVEWLSAEAYPFADAAPALRRFVNEFGAERVTWASDYTVARRADLFAAHPPTWGQLVNHIALSEAFTEVEKEWLLGRTITTLLDWHPTD